MIVVEYEIWFKFFCIYLYYQKIDTPESLIVLFSPEKLALLSYWKRLNPLLVAKWQNF